MGSMSSSLVTTTTPRVLRTEEYYLSRPRKRSIYKVARRIRDSEVEFIKGHYTRGIMYLCSVLTELTYSQVEHALTVLDLRGYSEYCRHHRRAARVRGTKAAA